MDGEASSGRGGYGKTFLLMLAGGLLGGFYTYSECTSQGATVGQGTAVFLFLAGAGLSAVVVPLAWKLGRFVGRLAQPDIIFTSTATELVKKRIGFQLLPFALAAGGAFLSVAGVGSILGARCMAPSEPIEPAGVAESSEQEHHTTQELPEVAATRSEAPIRPKKVGQGKLSRSFEAGKVTPSFNCEQATASAEHLICRDELLTAFDNALSDNYKALLASDLSGLARHELKDAQRRWIIERNRCITHECVQDIYHRRIDELCRYAVAARVTPSCRSAEMVIAQVDRGPIR